MAYCTVNASIERFHHEEDRATEIQERADAAGMTVEELEDQDAATMAENRYWDMMDNRGD